MNRLIVTMVLLMGFTALSLMKVNAQQHKKVTDHYPIGYNENTNGIYKQISTLGISPTYTIGGEEFTNPERNFSPRLNLRYAGDLNGDGYDDYFYTVVAANETTQDLADEVTKTVVLYGSADGIDANNSEIIIDGYTFLADLTGDGQPESIQYKDGTLYLIVDESNGDLQTLTEIDLLNVNINARYSAHGDLNGDGFDDIIVYNRFIRENAPTENYVIYGGNNVSEVSIDTLAFSTIHDTVYDREDQKMAYSDIDNDGTVELVQVVSGEHFEPNQGDNEYGVYGYVRILRSNGSGGFEIISRVALNSFWLRDIYLGSGNLGLADINGDSNEELLLEADGTLNIYELSSENTLSYDLENSVATESVGNFSILNDFNDDGQKELLLYGQESIHFTTIDENFNFTKEELPEQDGDVIYPILGDSENLNSGGDVNGDGLADIVIGFENSDTDTYGYRVHFGNSSGSLTDTSDTQIQFLETQGVEYVTNLGDLNGDGILDYGISYGSSDIHVFFGGPFASSEEANLIFEYESNTFAPRYGDFNGDGLSDMIVTQSGYISSEGDSINGMFYVYFGGSSMDKKIDHTVEADNIYPDSLGFISMGNVNSIGDINNDGYDDIAFVSEQEMATTKIIYGGPSMSTIPDVELPFFSSEFISLGDFNDEGIDDFAINFLNQNTINIHLGFDEESGASFDPAPYLIIPAPQRDEKGNVIQSSFFGFSMTSGDFDGDGVSDLATNKFSSINSSSDLNEGGPLIYIFKGGSSADSIADGIIYLLAEQFSNSYTYNWNPNIDTLNNALGSISMVPDQNGDGADELIFASTIGYSANAGVFFGGDLDTMGTHLGVFMEAPNPSLSLGPWANYLYAANGYPAAGDFDGDGKNDYLLPQSNDQNFRVDPVYIFSSDEFSVSNEELMSNVEGFKLQQNYPNPFNPTTQISYNLPVSGNVELQVFDITGRLVSTMVDQRQNAGKYSMNFDATHLASGIYIYRLKAAGVTKTRKMMLIK